MRASNMRFAPWLEDELRGIAEGSGVEYGRIERLNLRVWNSVPRGKHSPSACTSIGMQTADAGIIVGGTWMIRVSVTACARLPQNGLAHVMITLVGAAWGHNGMNAAGSSVAQSSLGGYAPELPRPDTAVYLRGSLGTRLLLEHCRDVPSALALLRKIRPESSYVLGDAAGKLVACQCLGGLEPVVQDADAHGGMVFSTNHIHMPELLERLSQTGCQPDIAEHSAVRFAAVARARDQLPRTLAAFQAILRSHDGYPHSVCRDGTAFSTFCLPQRMPTVFNLADRPPCRNAFYEYPIRPAVESGKCRYEIQSPAVHPRLVETAACRNVGLRRRRPAPNEISLVGGVRLQLDRMRFRRPS